MTTPSMTTIIEKAIEKTANQTESLESAIAAYSTFIQLGRIIEEKVECAKARLELTAKIYVQLNALKLKIA